MSHPVRFALAILGVCLLAPAQEWIVDVHNGPGTHYTSLGAAFAGAPSGSVLRVRAGRYYESPSTGGNKSLTVIGEPGAELWADPVGGFATLSINALAAGKSFTMVGVQLRTEPFGYGYAVTCSQCVGQVHIGGLVPAAYPVRYIFQLDDCQQVTFRDSSFWGRYNVTNTNLVVENCSISASKLAALRMVGGSVQLIDSVLQGYSSSAAISLVNTKLAVRGASELHGGVMPGTTAGIVVPTGPAISGTGVATLEPSVLLSGTSPQIASTVATTIATLPSVKSTFHAGALPTFLRAQARGPVGEIAWLVVSLPGPSTELGLGVPLWLDPATAIVAAAGVMPPSGLVQTLALPIEAGLGTGFFGLQLNWQLLTFQNGSALRASNPSQVTVTQ